MVPYFYPPYHPPYPLSPTFPPLTRPPIYLCYYTRATIYVGLSTVIVVGGGGYNIEHIINTVMQWRI